MNNLILQKEKELKKVKSKFTLAKVIEDNMKGLAVSIAYGVDIDKVFYNIFKKGVNKKSIIYSGYYAKFILECKLYKLDYKDVTSIADSACFNFYTYE